MDRQREVCDSRREGGRGLKESTQTSRTLYEISTPRKPANKTPPEHVVHSSSLSSCAHNCIVEVFFRFFFSSATFILVSLSSFVLYHHPLLIFLPRWSVFFLFFLGSRRARTPPRLHSEILGDVPLLDKLSIYFRLLIGIAPTRYGAKFLSSRCARDPQCCLIRQFK